MYQVIFKRQEKKINFDDDKNDFLISISDLMTGIMMVFVLTLVAVLYNKTTEIAEKSLQLSQKESELISTQAALNTKKTEIAEKSLQLAQKENELISTQQDIIKKQQVLSSKEIEIKYYKEKVDRIIGVKASIIEVIRSKFEKAAPNLKLNVDPQSGSIRMSGDILFDTDSDSIKEQFKPTLKIILEIYTNILFDTKSFVDHLAEIVIEGHADNRGSYIYNLDLSQRRAQSIMKYFISVIEPSKTDFFQKFVTANGKSHSIPIYDAAGNIDMDKSRRIEIKFRLKDEEALKELSRVLSGE